MKTPLKLVDGMYPKAFNKALKPKHSPHCTATFAQRDLKCHRCVELMLGAAPRTSWHHEYYARRFHQLQRSLPFS